MSLYLKEIRGNVNSEITNEFASNLGNRLGNFINKCVVNVGRDDTPISQMISQSLTSGIMAAGINVNDYGVVPLPIVHYLSNFNNGDIQLNISSNHNKTEIKIYSDYEIFLEDNRPKRVTGDKVGKLKYLNNKYIDKYHEAILKNIENEVIINKRPKVLIECGNKYIVPFITQILNSYGVDNILFSFENSDTDTNREQVSKSENISTLSDMVTTVGADLGISLDNVVDKVVFLDENGATVRDQTMIGIFAKDSLKKKKGTIVSSVVSSLALEEVVNQTNGKLIKTPVNSILNEAVTSKAIFAGDEPGRYVFPQFQSCSDPIFASVMLLKIISENKPLSKLAEEIPEYHRTGFTIKCDHENKSKAIQNLKFKLQEKGNIDTTDGVRADFGDSYILVRPSNFEPVLKIYIETKEPEQLSSLNRELHDLISEIK
jgi:phosphomannomutase/phosphoglucomutase